MSQKAVVETLEIPVDQIKPSPYQPRMAFNLEDIRGSIQRDGILIPLTVRKKDGDYELIDGERRTRLAKELGYKTIPVTVIDVDDDTARRMVWKVNTLRQDYAPNEKAYYFQRLQEEFGMSLRGIARDCDQSPQTVLAYLNVFKLPDEYQQMIWGGEIPIRVIRALEPLFNGVARATPLSNIEIFEHLDRTVREKHYGAEQIEEAIKPYLSRLREEQIEKAKEALAEVKPEVKVPETPEELETTARALRKEARRKREAALTPREKAEKERAKEEKRRKSEEAKKRLEEERERRIQEEAKKRARELEETEKLRIVEEAKKNAQEEILSSPQLLQEVAHRAREERSEEFAEMEKRAREAAESIAQPLAEALIKAEEDSKVARSSEERRLLESCMLLGSIIQSLRNKTIFCTKHDHEEPMLMWSCGTPITKTHEELRGKLRLGK